MKMSVDRKKNLTFLWLAEEENADRTQKEKALAQVKMLTEKGNRAVVFISGKQDLFPLMEGMVKHNAKIAE